VSFVFPLLFGAWKWFAAVRGVSWIVGSFSGVIGFLGPLGSILSAILVPLFDAVSRLLVYCLTSIAEGIRISLSNIAAFWILYPVLFLSGGWYFGYIDPFAVREAKQEVREVKQELHEVKQENVKLKKQLPGGGAKPKTKKRAAPAEQSKWPFGLGL
jgi:hypothetical protein